MKVAHSRRQARSGWSTCWPKPCRGTATAVSAVPQPTTVVCTTRNHQNLRQQWQPPVSTMLQSAPDIVYRLQPCHAVLRANIPQKVSKMMGEFGKTLNDRTSIGNKGLSVSTSLGWRLTRNGCGRQRSCRAKRSGGQTPQRSARSRGSACTAAAAARRTARRMRRHRRPPPSLRSMRRGRHTEQQLE